jgi:hypothetical protein
LGRRRRRGCVAFIPIVVGRRKKQIERVRSCKLGVEALGVLRSRRL